MTTNGLAALGVAAVMWLEDAVDGLATTSTDASAGRRLAANIAALGADLSAPGAAAVVLARRRGDAA